MEVRLNVVDLFCSAGGASAGYFHAGCNVVGVDIVNQPRYPFPFVRDDALSYLINHYHEYDFIHASPPCQRYSNLSKSWNGKPTTHPDLIPELRDILELTGKPFIIENVVGSPLRNPVMLCGTMFGLRVYRHRLFESTILITTPPHNKHTELCFTHDKRKRQYGLLNEYSSMVQVTGGGNCSVKAARLAMGIDWMNKSELNEAIPPAYTCHLGRQIVSQLSSTEQSHHQ